jgi:hypothetical protein
MPRESRKAVGEDIRSHSKRTAISLQEPPRLRKEIIPVL